MYNLKQEENFYLMNYENQVTQVTAMTAPSGGTQKWKATMPNRMDNSLPDEKNNTLEIKLRHELDQDEFEALCIITVNIDNSSPGITKMKTTKVSLTKYYEFSGYTPATKTYLYTWKGKESLPNSPKIFASEARQGKMQACALDDIDDLREDILKKAGNLTYYLNGDKNQTTPPTFAFLNLQGSGLEGGWANNYFCFLWYHVLYFRLQFLHQAIAPKIVRTTPGRVVRFRNECLKPIAYWGHSQPLCVLLFQQRF